MIVYSPPTRHAFTPGKVVFVSGLSDPTCCALSPIQIQFLKALALPEEWKSYRNFPWLPGPEASRDVPLVRASLANLNQFLFASRPRYRAAARRHWDALTQATDELIVITLSCGLEIVNHLLSPDSPPTRLFALGPVAWRAPSVPHTLFQGGRDRISRLFFRRVQVRLPNVGHLDYLANPSLATLINDSLCGSTSTSQALASTDPVSH